MRDLLDTKQNEKVVVRPNTPTMLSFFNCFIILQNTYIGIGSFENSKFVSSGIILFTVINAFFALLSYYSTYLILSVLKKSQKYSYESAWKKAGFKFTQVISIGIFAPCIIFISLYFHHMDMTFTKIITTYVPKVPKFISGHYFFSGFCFILVYLPLYFVQNLIYTCFLSYIGVALMLVYLVIEILWILQKTSDVGFDPNHQLKLFSFGGDLLEAIGSFVATYCAYSYIPFGVSQLRNLSFDRAKKLMKYSMLGYFIYNEICCILGYFVTFDREEKNILDCLDIRNITVLLANIIFLVKLVVMIPTGVFPTQVAVLSFIDSDSAADSKTFLWPTVTFIVLAMAWICSPLNSSASTLIIMMTQLFNSFVMIMEFVFPAMIGIMAVRMNYIGKLHWIGIVIMMALGAAFVIYALIGVVSAAM